MTLGPAAVGKRLDRALADALAADGVPISRSALRRAFAGAKVRIDGEPAKPSRCVETVTVVEVVLPAREPLRAQAEAIPLTILFEDTDVLVVDKAAPMVVHASAGHAAGTLVNAVLHHLERGPAALPVLAGNDATRPGIVHRLDRDTSGVMVVAKSERAALGLAAQFQAHTIERAYLGLVHGNPTWERRRVESRHGRDPRDRRRFAPHVGTRAAISEVEVLEQLAGAALCRFTLHTGRTHQIRMHARWLRHPILADALYGVTAHADGLRKAVARLSRHALHAAVLGFSHPATGAPSRFESPLPADLNDVLGELRPAPR